MNTSKKITLWLEWALLYLAAPLAIVLSHSRSAMFGLLWVGAAVGAIVLYKIYHISPRVDWNWPAVRWHNLRPMLLRFFLCAIVITAITIYLVPERVFAFPKERPGLWLMVMLIYPVLSAYPQEILYRSFYVKRYGALFRNNLWLVMITSAVLFGYAHIILKNPVAIILSAVGGVLFAHTYMKTKSLALVTIEHALYGNFIFTIGLGWYFYGAAWQ